MKYKILPHMADLKIRVFGKTKRELFKNALLAMTSGLRPKIKNKNAKIKNIRIKSLSLETLLIDFLSQVLYLTQVNKEVYNDIKFSKFTDTKIDGKLKGKEVEEFGEDIKAVTYHNLDVHQRKEGRWEATVLFDI